MTELDNLYDVKELINNNRYVMIIWYDNECPVCEHYLDTIKGLPEDIPEYKYGLVEGKVYKGDKIFEPDISPVTFLFKDGNRLAAPPGSAPIDIIHQNLYSIIDGTFKSREEQEKEQLDKL
jgi:hypothetical protein